MFSNHDVTIDRLEEGLDESRIHRVSAGEFVRGFEPVAPSVLARDEAVKARGHVDRNTRVRACFHFWFFAGHYGDPFRVGETGSAGCFGCLFRPITTARIPPKTPPSVATIGRTSPACLVPTGTPYLYTGAGVTNRTMIAKGIAPMKKSPAPRLISRSISSTRA